MGTLSLVSAGFDWTTTNANFFAYPLKLILKSNHGKLTLAGFCPIHPKNALIDYLISFPCY